MPKTTLMSVTDALERILQQAQTLQRCESVPLIQAYGRVLASPQTSSLNVPPADNSAMDGYAFAFDDLPQTDAYSLPISQRIAAGSQPSALTPGTAARIFTGAEIPAGADCVVMQEQCELSKDGTHVLIPAQVPRFNNIRPQGQDIRIGDTIAQQGDRITPPLMGLLASVGIDHVRVYKPVTVAILSTGDELAEPGEPLLPGQIYNSNRYMLAGLIQKMGLQLIDLGRIEDTLDATQKVLREASKSADIIISSGGVSVGEEDHVKHAVESLGSLDLWRMAIKPGKPIAFGHVQNTPFFGLPGNPVSTFVTFLLFARPYLQTMQGCKPILPSGRCYPAAFSRPSPSVRREYVRVLIDEQGTMQTYPNQSSGALSSTAWSNALAIVPENTTIHTGDLVTTLRYDDLF